MMPEMAPNGPKVVGNIWTGYANIAKHIKQYNYIHIANPLLKGIYKN